MYNKKTLTFTFHPYLGGFLSGDFCPRGAFVQGAFVLDPLKSCVFLHISYDFPDWTLELF